MKSTISAVKGTRDFYPEEMAVRTWLYHKISQVAASFGYQEYEGPFLEKIDLYAAKSGEELVKEQSFVFPDRGGDLISLRPELTPTLARMVAKRQNELILPLRWWSFGPFWRYERPQKGRTREFFQWNIDLIGSNSTAADAEIVAIAATFFKAAGLNPQQVQILVNNRRLMDAELAGIRIPPEKRPDVFHLIDRRDKMPSADWEEYAGEMGLDTGQITGLKAVLSNPDVWKKSTELVELFSILKHVGLDAFVKFDPQVIRGLDYYTGIVFEARDTSGEGRAVLGGGRYDNLVSDVGGDPLPGVGFAMGDVMTTLLLQKYGCLPEFKGVPETVFMTVFDPERLKSSISLANEIRRGGIRTICHPEGGKLEKQLKTADRLGIRLVVIMGPDEEARDRVLIKDLKKRTQVELERKGLVEAIRAMLAEESPV